MVIVTDRHGLVRKKLGGKEEFVKIEHSFDWWHFSKWLRKRSKPLAKAHPVIGHIPLNYYRSRIDPSISPICSYCFYKNETNQHFLFVCPYFQPLRKKLLGSHRISPADIQKVRQASALDPLTFQPLQSPTSKCWITKTLPLQKELLIIIVLKCQTVIKLTQLDLSFIKWNTLILIQVRKQLESCKLQYDMVLIQFYLTHSIVIIYFVMCAIIEYDVFIFFSFILV